jgi:hypothetical protein
MTEEDHPREEEQAAEEWIEPPAEWIGHEVSLWHHECSGPRGGTGSTQTLGILEVVNEWGAVIDEEHPEVPEGVLAFYPWHSVVSIKVGEPEEPSQRRRSIRGRRERQIEGPEKEPRSGPTGPSGPSRRPQGPSGPSRRPQGPSGPSRRPQGPSGPKRRPEGPRGPGRR